MTDNPQTNDGIVSWTIAGEYVTHPNARLPSVCLNCARPYPGDHVLTDIGDDEITAMHVRCPG